MITIPVNNRFVMIFVENNDTLYRAFRNKCSIAICVKQYNLYIEYLHMFHNSIYEFASSSVRVDDNYAIFTSTKTA